MTADPAEPPTGARLYLDVDGVLLAADGRDMASPSTAPIDVAGTTVHARWDRAVVAGLDAALAATGTELVWLTTWQQHAATALAPALGFAAGRGARHLSEEGDFAAGSSDWKHTALLGEQGVSPSAFAWIDDVVLNDHARTGPAGLARRLADARAEAGAVPGAGGRYRIPPFLLIAADQAVGLRVGEVDLVAAFLRHPLRRPLRRPGRRPRWSVPTRVIYFPGGHVRPGRTGG